MTDYLKTYEKQTGIHLGLDARRLDPLFEKIAAKELLPPRGQQAVDCGFTAHTLNDPHENPAIYHYYNWVMKNIFVATQVHELPAKIIGDEIVCVNIFQTDWPQPLTVNRWQVEDVLALPLITGRVVVIENNGVFIWLHHLHPSWPLILQSGNDFNDVHKQVILALSHKLALAYLGDLDTAGIQIVDTLTSLIKGNGGDASHLADLQSPAQVAGWVAGYGIPNGSRLRIDSSSTIIDPTWQQEANFLEISGQFVEQEQLIGEYERVVEEWLTCAGWFSNWKILNKTTLISVN